MTKTIKTTIAKTTRRLTPLLFNVGAGLGTVVAYIALAKPKLPPSLGD